MREDVVRRVEGAAARDLARGQGDDGGDYNGDVDIDTERLDARHDVAGEDGAGAVDEDQASVQPVDGAVGCAPGAVAGDRDAGQDQEGERIIHRADSAD